MNGSRRRVLLFAVLASFVVGTGVFAPPANAGNGKAGVVVVHGNGQVKTECVRLTKSQISGFRLLKNSSFEFQAAKFTSPPGHGICWLDGEGVATTDTGSCFPSNGPNWAYFTQDRGGSGPASSDVGSDERTVTRGSIDYWVFGNYPQPTPQKLTLRAICG
jgi:hypothetical protein